jgi:opacity protein-like surface antigen
MNSASRRVCAVVALVVVAAALTGCARQDLSPLAAGTRGARADVASPAGRLAADFDESMPVVELPPLARLPRTIWTGGSTYALVYFSPYVGQFGVLAEYERADAGMGLGIAAGTRVPFKETTVLGLEFILDSSAHTNTASGVGATAMRTLCGARMSFAMDKKLSPFALAGGGLYSLEYDTLDPEYDLSGLGFMLGGGVDFAPKKKVSLRAELDVHFWVAQEQGAGGGGLATTVCLVLGGGMSF